MAGSINHVKKEDGTWVDADGFYNMIDNLGDAFEMYEEFTILVDKLKQENEKLKDALGFYADENNWNRSNKCLFNRVNIFDVELTKNKTVKEVYYKNLEVGGKLARLTLKEIEEQNEKNYN